MYEVRSLRGKIICGAGEDVVTEDERRALVDDIVAALDERGAPPECGSSRSSRSASRYVRRTRCSYGSMMRSRDTRLDPLDHCHELPLRRLDRLEPANHVRMIQPVSVIHRSQLHDRLRGGLLGHLDELGRVDLE